MPVLHSVSLATKCGHGTCICTAQVDLEPDRQFCVQLWMCVRLQVAGYYNRYIGYTGDGFKEGVSLTHYDELMRWQKYAWGCSELIFNPLAQWFNKGPINALMIRFLLSDISFFSKVSHAAGAMPVRVCTTRTATVFVTNHVPAVSRA